MKTSRLLLPLALLIAAPAQAEELFAAHVEGVFSGAKYQPKWRVTTGKKGLIVEYTAPDGKSFRTNLKGVQSDNLRTQIESLGFTQADADALRALPQHAGDQTIVLRPFDGVTYYFSIQAKNGARKVCIDNPAFDLSHNQHSAQLAPLKDALGLLESIEKLARSPVSSGP